MEQDASQAMLTNPQEALQRTGLRASLVVPVTPQDIQRRQIREMEERAAAREHTETLREELPAMLRDVLKDVPELRSPNGPSRVTAANEEMTSRTSSGQLFSFSLYWILQLFNRCAIHGERTNEWTAIAMSLGSIIAPTPVSPHASSFEIGWSQRRDAQTSATAPM